MRCRRQQHKPPEGAPGKRRGEEGKEEEGRERQGGQGGQGGEGEEGAEKGGQRGQSQGRQRQEDEKNQGEEGEGSFELTFELKKDTGDDGAETSPAQMSVWYMPAVKRQNPNAKEGVVDLSEALEPVLAKHRATIDSEDSSHYAPHLFETCPVDDVMAWMDKENRSFFVAGQFPPNYTSLNREPTNSKIVQAPGGWARFHEVSAEPMLYGSGVDPDAVIQGQIGNCWMVACFAALGLLPEVAEELIYPPSYNPKGIYALRIWDCAGWRREAK